MDGHRHKGLKKTIASWVSDNYIRNLGWVALAVIIGFLLTVVIALWQGTFNISGTPRSVQDENLVVAHDAFKNNPTNADLWQAYVSALIDTGNIRDARAELERASQFNLDTSRGFQVTYIEGRLAQNKKDTAHAIACFEAVVTDTMLAYETELARGDVQKNWALAYGIHENYRHSLLELAGIYTSQSQWDLAEEVLTTYLEMYPNDAGIFVDRGNARTELEDYLGAAEDFKRALDFVPDFQEAIKGLEKIEGRTL
jgi:tetratricopeptide (TPR) repeat protein